MTMITPDAKLISRGIALQEGWRRPASVQFANRNPGNIMDLEYFKKTKAFQLRKFPDWESGWTALGDLVQRRMCDRGLTLLEFIGGKLGVYAGFAPAAHGNNQPRIYAENLGKWLGVPPDMPYAPDWSMKITTDLPRWGGTKSTDVSRTQ